MHRRPGKFLIAFLLLWAGGIPSESQAALTMTTAQNLVFHPATTGDGTGVISPSTDTGLAAKFNITGGVPGTAYTITLPGNNNMTFSGKHIVASSFLSSPASGNLDGTGAATIYLGATHAAIAAGDPQGTYISGNINFKVKVGATNLQSTFTASIVITSSISIVTDANLAFPNCTRNDGSYALLPTAPTAAKFTVSGGPNLQYSIALPATLNITTGAGGPNGTIVVNNFTTSPVSPVSLGASGSSSFNVGATRAAILSTQTLGTYSGTFTVTVSYY
jgi:hypothetical protein